LFNPALLERRMAEARLNSMKNIDDIIGWDVINWSVALDYWKEHTVQDLATSSAMEIGCGHGGLSLWAVSNGMKVLCTDL